MLLGKADRGQGTQDLQARSRRRGNQPQIQKER